MGMLTLTSNGSVDFRGRIAYRQTTGGRKGASFSIVSLLLERIAFFTILASLMIYLVQQMHESVPTAAAQVQSWTGAVYLLPLFGAFIADAYLGRFRTIMIFSCIYIAGVVALTLSASIDNLHPPPCKALPCIEANDSQMTFLFVALGLIALANSGIQPCIAPFGADQFDEADEKEAEEKVGYFNWIFFTVNMGALISLTVLVYVVEKKGWIWGFGTPAALVMCSIIIQLIGVPYYRYRKPMGSPLTRFAQVIVVSVKNHFRGVEVRDTADLYEVQTKMSDISGAQKLAHTDQYRFLDKAALVTDPNGNTKDRWSLCTVTQVEELKSMVRLLPIWASTLSLSISFAQQPTFFLNQATVMNRNLVSNFIIPIGSVGVFSAISAIILIPLYEFLMVPMLRNLTGHPRGITSLQRVGIGLFLAIFGLASAALVEQKRLKHPQPLTMSVYWLFPQFFLTGSAEVLACAAQFEFFYDEATDGTRSVSNALLLCEFGVGAYLSGALVKIVEGASGGQEKGWLRRDLNHSKLHYFYWILTGIDVFCFFVFLWVTSRYKGRVNATVVDATLFQSCDREEKKEENCTK